MRTPLQPGMHGFFFYVRTGMPCSWIGFREQQIGYASNYVQVYRFQR